MGGGRFDSSTYTAYASANTLRVDGTRKAHTEIFTAHKVNSKYDPKNIGIRESVDSPTSPNSRPIIVGLDFSGSMGAIAGEMANNQLGVLMTKIVEAKIISDPHLMFLGIDDIHVGELEALQATQFEADIRIAEQLGELKNIGHGGGNGFESYNLAWAFALNKTSIDSFKKRGKKGLLFTIGDEGVPADLNSTHLRQIFGSGDIPVLNNRDLLKAVGEEWEVFHIIAEQGTFYRGQGDSVRNQWYKLLGKKALLMSDYTKVSDIIIAATAIYEGSDIDYVMDNIGDAGTRDVVRHALFDLSNEIAERVTMTPEQHRDHRPGMYR